LRNNQKNFITKWDVQEILGVLQERVGKSFYQFPELEMARASYMLQPHAKKAERCETLWELTREGKMWKTWDGSVKGKIKLEFGKPGKYPRQFISLGTEAIYSAGFVMESLKKVFVECLGDLGYEAFFVPGPSNESMRGVFSTLYIPKLMAFFYFSDDGSLSIRCDDGRIFMANIDISSCDTSHTQSLFDLLLAMTIGNDILHGLVAEAIKQCKSTIKLSSYIKGGGIVELTPKEALLYTGSVLTTLINNLANLLIFLSIKKELIELGHLPTFSDCRRLILVAAEKCGYIVTVDVCSCPHELQFLKQSPAMVDGIWIPFLNLGVLLRMFGHCWGDLPGQGSIEDRAFEWNAALTLSLRHAGNHALTKLLRVKFARCKPSNETLKRVEAELTGKWFTSDDTYIPDDQICMRYGVSLSELYEFLELFSEASFGDVIDTVFTRAVMTKDYSFDYSVEMPSGW
jgi:hypothetical protein